MGQDPKDENNARRLPLLAEDDDSYSDEHDDIGYDDVGDGVEGDESEYG